MASGVMGCHAAPHLRSGLSSERDNLNWGASLDHRLLGGGGPTPVGTCLSTSPRNRQGNGVSRRSAECVGAGQLGLSISYLVVFGGFIERNVFNSVCCW